MGIKKIFSIYNLNKISTAWHKADCNFATNTVKATSKPWEHTSHSIDIVWKCKSLKTWCQGWRHWSVVMSISYSYRNQSWFSAPSIAWFTGDRASLASAGTFTYKHISTLPAPHIHMYKIKKKNKNIERQNCHPLLLFYCFLDLISNIRTDSSLLCSLLHRPVPLIFSPKTKGTVFLLHGPLSNHAHPCFPSFPSVASYLSSTASVLWVLPILTKGGKEKKN